MKIGFLVSTLMKDNEGIGGHYFSLLSIAEALEDHHDIVIINIGIKESQALKHSKFKVKYVIKKYPSPFRTWHKLRNIIKEEKIEILHAYDIPSYFWARLLGRIFKIPYILTKCGGPPALKYFPRVNTLILFSKEDLDFFKTHEKNKNAKIYLIPNRVVDFSIDNTLINKVREKYDLGKYDKIILRISRIGYYFEKSNKKLIQLVKRLKDEKINVCLIIIGIIEYEHIYAELKALNSNIIIASEPELTKDAKKIIGIADCVMGTGRSFMEAASKELIMLASCHNAPFPLLVSENNFQIMFYHNFSERSIIKDMDAEKNFQQLKSLLTDERKNEEYKAFIRKKSDDYFNLKNVIHKYNKIYKTINYQPGESLLDFLLNYYQFVKHEIKNLIPPY